MGNVHSRCLCKGCEWVWLRALDKWVWVGDVMGAWCSGFFADATRVHGMRMSEHGDTRFDFECFSEPCGGSNEGNVRCRAALHNLLLRFHGRYTS